MKKKTILSIYGEDQTQKLVSEFHLKRNDPDLLDAVWFRGYLGLFSLVFVAWASLGKTGWLGSFVTTLLPVYPFSTPTTARQSANNMSDKEILSQSKRLKKKSNLLWEAFQEVHPCIELS